jgi:glycosyltransferase involved in cell wall biosynthesis
MRIAMVHDYPPVAGGGLEINVYETSKLLIARGHEVLIFTTRTASHSFQERLRLPSFVKIVSPSNEVIQYIINGSDIIHVHLTFSLRTLAFKTIEQCSKTEKPLIVSFHTTPSHLQFSSVRSSDKSFAMLRYLINQINHSDCRIVTYSRHNVNELKRIGLMRTISFVRLGIRKEFLEYEKTNITKVFDIVFVGELSLLKGIDLLLGSLVILEQKYGINPMTVVLGDGPQRHLVEERVNSDSLNLAYKGYVSNNIVKYFLSRSHIYVCLSRSEMFGLSVLEALAMKVLVLATNVGGIPEVLSNGKYGLLVKPSSCDIAAGIFELLDDPTLRQQFLNESKEACDTIRARYTLEQQVNSYEDIYRDLANRKL